MLPKPKRGLLLKPHLTHFIFTINILKKVMLKAKQMQIITFVHLWYRCFKRKEIDTYFLTSQSYS